MSKEGTLQRHDVPVLAINLVKCSTHWQLAPRLMHTKNLFRFTIPLALLTILALGALAQTATNRFGFSGPEIFPIDAAISLLHAADLDGDGLNDLIVVNNARSKINLLYNQTGKTNAAARAKPAARSEMNELPPDARFRIESIATEKRIAALVVTDLNGDG